MIKRVGLVLGVMGVAGLALAGTMPDDIRDRLIEKFERVHLQLTPADSSRVPVTLRLGDLLAERARLAAMNELDKGCIECVAGVEDRKRALELYKSVLAQVPVDQKVKIISQMGHLYDVLGEGDQAVVHFEKIVKENGDDPAAADALGSLGEMAFKSRNYGLAKKHYLSALAHPKILKKGFVTYRLAWSYFNLGENSLAEEKLVKILKSPKLLTRNEGDVVSEDAQFKEEVSRDLATFMARDTVSMENAMLVYELSPEKVRLNNVAYLASEVERLGQVEASIDLWKFVQQRESRPVKRFDGLIHMAQLERNIGRKSESLTHYFSAVRLFSQLPQCDDSQCRERKSRLRHYILDWHKLEHKKPTTELADAYKKFLGVFPKDYIFRVNLAKLYQQFGRWKLAFLSYKNVIDAMANGDVAIDKELPSLEELLLSSIEVSESSKTADLTDKAYSQYISLSKTKTQIFQVRYQQSYSQYKKNQYNKAAQGFYELALSKELGGSKLKAQAADLALDSLVLLKDDARLGQWAAQLGTAFPGKIKEYNRIVRTSAMNQVAVFATGSHQLKAWGVLAGIKLEGASNQEKGLYWKNRFLLAEKLGKFDEAREAVGYFLSVPGISDLDRKMALTKKSWLAELQLDFKTAFQVSKNLKVESEKPDKRWLRLALFAELAGENYYSYYEKFLRVQKDPVKTRLIVARWLEETKQPQKTYKKLKKYLVASPDLHGLVLLELFAKTNKKVYLSSLLKNKVLAGTPAGKAAWNLQFFEKFKKQKSKLVGMSIDTKNQRKLSRSIKGRVRQLDKSEAMLKKAIMKEQWSAQVLLIDLLALENKRFFEELLSLPMPDGLSPEEQQQYLRILSEQAAPHNQRSQALLAKKKELLEAQGIVEQYEKELKETKGAIRNIVVQEIEMVKDLFSVESKARFTASIEAKPEVPIVPSLDVVESARQAVRERPFDSLAIGHLMDVEKQLGRNSMVSYLNGRRAYIAKKYPSATDKTTENASEVQ